MAWLGVTTSGAASETVMAVILAMLACKLSRLDNKCACVSDTAMLATFAVAKVLLTAEAVTAETVIE